MPDMNAAIRLLEEYIESENLRRHCFAVSSAMMMYAERLGRNTEEWGMAGLLHDLDWEKFPDTHPNTAVPVLKEAGYSDEIISAILGHAYPERTDVKRETDMARYLFACDEITGFITAYAYMKPGGLENVDSRGVKKKLKDKAFAKNVNRDDIIKGAEEIGIPFDEHLDNVITAMKSDPRVNPKH